MGHIWKRKESNSRVSHIPNRKHVQEIKSKYPVLERAMQAGTHTAYTGGEQNSPSFWRTIYKRYYEPMTLTPWKKSYDQPRQHIKKQRHYFASKGPSSQGYGFSSSHVWMESWTVKKAEHRRIDAFELWCWRRLLRVPWTPRRSNQSILKKITPGCSLEGLMLKLKLQ